MYRTRRKIIIIVFSAVESIRVGGEIAKWRGGGRRRESIRVGGGENRGEGGRDSKMEGGER